MEVKPTDRRALQETAIIADVFALTINHTLALIELDGAVDQEDNLSTL